MSRRNTVYPSCGRKGRAACLGGPQCGAVWLPPKCACGTMTVLRDPPPKNRKPDVAPDGHRRRYGTRGGKPGRAP